MVGSCRKALVGGEKVAGFWSIRLNFCAASLEVDVLAVFLPQNSLNVPVCQFLSSLRLCEGSRAVPFQRSHERGKAAAGGRLHWLSSSIISHFKMSRHPCWEIRGHRAPGIWWLDMLSVTWCRFRETIRGIFFLSLKILRRRVVGSEKHKAWRGSKRLKRFGLERPHMTSRFRALFFHLGLWWYMITKAPDTTYIWKTAGWALRGQLRKNILLKKPILNIVNIYIHVFVGTHNADISNFVQIYVFLLWLYLHFCVWMLLFYSLIVAFKHLKMQHYSHARMFPFFFLLHVGLFSPLIMDFCKKKT